MSLDLHRSIVSDTKKQLHLLLREQERRKGLEDLHYFCKHILGYSDLTDKDGFHGEFCKHIESKKRFKLTLTPRGTLKSSIGTIGHSVQQIVIDPNIRILLASEKFGISKAFLTEIKGHFEKNDKFRALYGDFVGEDTWSKDEIIVKARTTWKKEPTVSCAGIDVTKVGMHYDRIKVDDPHSDQNTTNQDQIEKVIRWYRLLLSLLDPGKYIDINGTIWHYNDLYNYLENKDRERVQNKRKARFKIFKRDSFEGTNDDLLNGRVKKRHLLWPERLSSHFLQDQLLEQGPYIFSCQYRLRPIDDETATFKRSWIKTCPVAEVPKNLSVFSTIDPMRDAEGKDYLSIVTCGMDENWQAYILDVQRLKADEHDTVDAMFDVYKRFKPLRMGIETVAWQQSYYKYVMMLQIQRKMRLPIIPLKTSTRITKPMRIKSMIPYWKSGLFIIPHDGPLETLKGNMAALVDELTRYPKVANDDCIDALAYMNQLTHRPNVVSILTKLNPKSFKAVQAKNRRVRGKLGSRNVRERKYA